MVIDSHDTRNEDAITTALSKEGGEGFVMV